MNVLYFLTPKSQIKFISDFMSVRQALEVFEHYRFTVVPLLDKDGCYIGSLDEGDLLFFLKSHPFSKLEDFNDINITNVPRHRDYGSVNALTDINEIIGASFDQNFVPVIDDQKHFIGIITRKSIISYLADKK